MALVRPPLNTLRHASQILSTLTDSTAIASTTTETAFDQQVSIYGGTLAKGDTIDCTWIGLWGKSGATQPTMTFKVRWGSASGTTLLTFSAVTAQTSAFGNAPWEINAKIRVDSLTSFRCMARLSIIADSSSVVPTGQMLVPTTATTVATSADMAISLTATWGTSNAANTIKTVFAEAWVAHVGP